MGLFVDYARSTDLYRALCKVLHSPDGNLLEQTEDRLAEAQTEFLRWALHQASPTIIIETGTNKGMFCYLMSLVAKGVTIHTFDLNREAEDAVETINKAQTNVVCVFHTGDSRETLRKFDVRAQFAWIDGSHDFDAAMSDLLQCYRLRVPYVAVDDTAYPSVAKAVEYVLGHTLLNLAMPPLTTISARPG